MLSAEKKIETVVHWWSGLSSAPPGAPTHFAGVGSAPGPPQHHQYIRDDACANETSSVAELRLIHSFNVESKMFSSRVQGS